MQMQKKSLEICCYVCGAGAFSVFLRWLQDQLAFNEEGLVDKSIFNFLVPAFIIVCAFVFLRFVDGFKSRRFYLPDSFNEAFSNEGKLFTFFRWTFGIIMSAGAILLLAQCEMDKEAGFLRILAVLGFFSGLSYPIILSAANKPLRHSGILCLLSVMPILLYSMWLITCYKMNDINSVVWAFSIEIITVIVAMLAYFRIAGFLFGVPLGNRSMFLSMLCAAMCIMVIADERYIGMQMMFFASAGQMILYNWIMIKNLRQKKPQFEMTMDDGFERL